MLVSGRIVLKMVDTNPQFFGWFWRISLMLRVDWCITPMEFGTNKFHHHMLDDQKFCNWTKRNSLRAWIINHVWVDVCIIYIYILIYHGNPQPSFLGVVTHILGVENLHFSWFGGPRVYNMYILPHIFQPIVQALPLPWKSPTYFAPAPFGLVVPPHGRCFSAAMAHGTSAEVDHCYLLGDVHRLMYIYIIIYTHIIHIISE